MSLLTTRAMAARATGAPPLSTITNNLSQKDNRTIVHRPAPRPTQRTSPRHAQQLHPDSPIPSIQDADLLTPRSLTPESPATQRLFQREEEKASKKARAAFNVIKLCNKIGVLLSARSRKTKESTSLKKSNHCNSTSSKSKGQKMVEDKKKGKVSKSKRVRLAAHDHNDDNEEESWNDEEGLGVTESPPPKKRRSRRVIEDDDNDDEQQQEEEDHTNDDDDKDEGGGDDAERQKMFAMINRPREVFMEHAFGDKLNTNCIACRPQSELDYIVFVLEHWAVGHSVSSLMPEYDQYQAVKKF
jgi:hypothetical protein